jgi:hypothetical protein
MDPADVGVIALIPDVTPRCHDGRMSVELVIAARQALDELAAVDLDSCDREMLDGVLEHWRTLRSFTDVWDVRIARRSRELASEGRAETVEGILAQRGRRGKREARDAARREQACEQMPCFEQALADGAVATGHLDALVAATHGLDEAARAEFADHAETLLGLAEWQSVEAFTRECDELARNVSHDEGESRLARQKKQCRVRQWVDRMTGMHHLHAELDAESGARRGRRSTRSLRACATRRTRRVSPQLNRPARVAIRTLGTGMRPRRWSSWSPAPDPLTSGSLRSPC